MFCFGDVFWFFVLGFFGVYLGVGVGGVVWFGLYFFFFLVKRRLECAKGFRIQHINVVESLSFKSA